MKVALSLSLTLSRLANRLADMKKYIYTADIFFELFNVRCAIPSFIF